MVDPNVLSTHSLTQLYKQREAIRNLLMKWTFIVVLLGILSNLRMTNNDNDISANDDNHNEADIY